MADLRITVFPTRFVKGVESLVTSTDAESVPARTIRDAMGTVYQTDAHFVQYVTLADGAPVDTQYRLNKSVLGQLLARGATVALSVLAVDIDNPNHGPWSIDLVAHFDAALAKLPPNLRPAWIYRTRGGARFVYELADLLLVQDAEPRHRGLVKLLAGGAFLGSPFTVDPKCSDWTRFFRLPMVMRDEKPTAGEWYFNLDFDPSVQALDWRTLEAIGTSDVARLGAVNAEDPSREPAPEPEEARLLLQNQDGTETDFGRMWRSNVAGMRCQEALKTCTPPEEGGRDSTMMSYVGEVTRRCYGIPLNGTPAQAYAILLPLVEQMRPDAEHPNWAAWLWGRIGYAWRNLILTQGPVLPPNHEPHSELDEVKEEEFSLKARAEKVRLWYPTSALDDPNSEAAQVFVKRIAAVCVANRHYHVLRPSGFFDPNGVTIEHLGNELIRNGWANSFMLFNEDKEGNQHAISQGDLLKQLMVRHISRVEGHVGLGGDTVRALESDRPIYDMALYRLRTDIEPAWSDEVDELMMAQAGPDQIELYRKWMGYALDFSEPICMMALRGTNGIGKSFMGLGLADCLASPAPVLDGATLMSGFPEDLLHTPFVEIAEALPATSYSIKARDRLRQMIGGAAIAVNRKNRSVVWAHTMLRILITMNNDETIRQLADDEASIDDVKAIMQRTLVLQLREEAAEWLNLRGGKSYTRSWVSNGGSQQTDFKLARHLLFLHSVRDQWERGSRLLVEGEGYGRGDSETADTLMSSDSLLEVGATLCAMLAMNDKSSIRGLCIEGAPAVLSQAVLDWLSRPGRRSNLTVRMIGTQLLNLGTRGVNTSKLSTNGERIKARWFTLDLPKLLHLAQNHGWPDGFLAARVGQMGDSGV
jgi:hypothetical protein